MLIRQHINWTWIVVTVFRFGAAVFDSVVPITVMTIVWIGVTFWALWEKKRSLLWVIFPISVLFLENKRKYG